MPPLTNKPPAMRYITSCILLPLLALVLLSCDRTPIGVMSKGKMADLIVDLQIAEAYIENHNSEFEDDSSKLVLKQSIFKKHGITQQDYDTSLVWYAHNMEDYIKVYDKALGKLQARQDKLNKAKVDDNSRPADMMGAAPQPANGPSKPVAARHHDKKLATHIIGTDTKSDSADLWKGTRHYMLTQGAKRGFITFDIPPDANKRPGDRYQLAYKLYRGGNEFKVSLNVDYTDGSTSQITRGTNSDGWVTVDVQSDTARQVRRIYGYVSYDMKRGHTAYVDSLMLMRTHLSKSNYGFINAQRLLERDSK